MNAILKYSNVLLGLSLAAVVALPASGQAQQTQEQAQQTQEDEQQGEADSEQASPYEGIETIIVTGSASGGISEFESSIAITSFNEGEIRESAPLTITDLYAEVPGVWAETSGGESAANVFVRGIPAPGQFRFTKLQIDGMPTIEETGLPFLPPESYIKLDETIQRVEAVRGGTSTIFASNAAGGIINHITKRGGDFHEGYLGFEYGDFGRTRYDGFSSGPVSDRLRYAVGGFFRTDDGVRDPGFTANDGGQIRGNLTYDLDDGDINVYGHFLDDHNIFYLPIPLGLTDGGNLTDLPGFNANTDTLTSDDVLRARLVLPGGTRERDLSDGINTKASSFGVEFNHDFDDWRLSNNTRYVDGETIFNAIFSITAPVDGRSFLDQQLARAQAAFPGTDRLALRFLGQGPGSGSTFDFAGDGSAGNNGNGLVIQSGWWNVETAVQNFQNDLRLLTDFEAGGRHTLTIGGYSSFADYQSEWNFNDILQEVDGSPRGLDVFAVDADGEVIGALTQNSFIGYGTFYRNYDADTRTLALYINDEWDVNDSLRLDFGLRYEELRIDGTAERLGTFDLSDQNDLIEAGGLPTLADDNVTFGTGTFDPFSETYDELAWAVGANYTFNDNIAVYARANDAFRTPDPNDLAASPANASNLPVNDIFQAESGIKLNYPFVRSFITLFYSDFSDQIFSDPVLDDNGNQVEAQVLLESETVGVEAEIDVGPFGGFSVNAKITLQEPEIEGFDIVGGEQAFGVVGDDFIGNDVQRIAKEIYLFEPRYQFFFGDFDGAAYAQIFHAGSRFANNGNSIILPSYTTLGVGLTLNWKNFEYTFTGDNLTNEIGITEGNPRTDAFATGDSSIATFARPIVGRNFRFKLGYRF